VTYGDGLADGNVDALKEAHQHAGTLATVATVQPTSRLGVIDVGQHGLVGSFGEKPTVDGWVSIGYFIMEQGVLEYLDGNAILEHAPLERLVENGELSAYRHQGFWQPMDTFGELKILNDLWNSGSAPRRPV